MSENELSGSNAKSISAMSEILGIPADVLRQIAKEYAEILPGKSIGGKVTVYDDSTVERFRKIADLQNQGCCKEVIIPAIRGSKSLEERAAEDMKRYGIENKPAIERQKHVIRVPQEKTRNTELETELLIAVRGLEQKLAAIDQRSAAIRETGDENLKKILDAVEHLAEDIAALKSECHILWDQVAELETYLQKQAEKPFWKR